MNNFFAYHAPGAIADAMTHYYSLTPAQFGLLFTLYSAPNVVLVFISGLAIDYYGTLITSLAFNTLMLTGAIVIALTPPTATALYALLFGRLLIGFGESLCAAIATILGAHFKGRALTFATGFNMAFVQLCGSAAAFYLLPLLRDVNSAQWMTVAVCAVSLMANILYVILQAFTPPTDTPAPPDEIVVIPTIASNGRADEYDRLLSALKDGAPTTGSRAHSTSPLTSALNGVKELPALYWLVIVMIALLSPILYTFTAFGPLLFMEKWHLTSEEAGSATSLLYVTIVLSPVTGALIDLTGHRTLWQVIFAAGIPLCFILIHTTHIAPWVGMALLGCMYAVTEANGYAMIAEVAPANRLGIAYGICACLVSAALLFEPALVGYIKTATGAFDLSNILFIVLAAAGAACALAIYVVDSRYDGLTPTETQREHSDETHRPTQTSYGTTETRR